MKLAFRFIQPGKAGIGVCRHLIWLTLLGILNWGNAFCQVYDFKSFTVRQGLISNGVTTLYQDSYGNLWIGTTDGISVYDGEIFKNYTVVNGLASSWVNCIVEDRTKKGVMWIGTLGGGVSKFENGVFSNYNVGKGYWSNAVNSISQGDDGTLFCATAEGIYTLKGGMSSPLTPVLSGRTFNQVTCVGDSLLLLDDKGDFFSYGLVGGAVHPLADKRMKGSTVSSYTFGSSGKLWVGLMNGTIVDYFGQKVLQRATDAPAVFLLDDGRGNLWAGGSNGLYKIDEQRFGGSRPIHFTTANGLPSDNVFTGLYDTEGDLWVGSGGLCKLGDQNNSMFKTSVPWQVVDNAEAAGDKDGHIWIVEEKGLLEIWRKKSGGIADALHTFEELGIKHPAYSLRISNGSRMWLCSDDGVFRSFRIESGKDAASHLRLLGLFSVGKIFGTNGFLCFMVDREGRIWCSLNKIGLVVIDPTDKARKRNPEVITDNLPDNSIRAMYEDSDGNFWFGGYLGGLAEFSHPFRKDFSTRLYTVADGLADNSVRAITEDNQGNLWIGTRFGGLSIMHGGKFRNITAKDGLASNGVWAICRDDDRGMLVGTQLGLQRLTETHNDNNIFQSLGETIPVYSVGVSSSDLRWACTAVGTTINDLLSKDYPRSPPVVRVTRFLVNGQELALADGPQLDYNRNTVTFVFAGISLRDAKNLTYRYALLGVDNGWRYAPHSHAVTYVSLKPGEYTFKVRAVSPSGIESSNIASLSFVIVPPYWQRWWFILGVIITLGSLVYSVIRVRVRRLLEIERVRSRIATDLHDDIGSGLTRIAVLAEVAARQTEMNGGGYNAGGSGNGSDEGYSAHKLVERIGANARELVDSMSDVVWSVDPKNMTVGDLLKRLRSFAFEISEIKGIAVEFSVDERIESMRVDPQILRALLLIAKEGLNNAVKHSRCKNVSIAIGVDDGAIVLKLGDDGCGFNGTDQKVGHGLGNMRRRAEKMGGYMNIISIPGSGTTIEAGLPIYV